MRKSIVGVFIVGWLAALTWGSDDPFQRVKQELAEAVCARFDFVGILESDIFDEVDSTYGTAYLAKDGRFRVEMGEEVYLYDAQYLYTYSPENNQVTIESIADDEELGKEILFLTHLDELYTTAFLKPGVYRLKKKERTSERDEIPDSLTVFLTPNQRRIERLEYLDINDERNTILILKQHIDSVCDDDIFVPDFPDSVERVKL